MEKEGYFPCLFMECCIDRLKKKKRQDCGSKIKLIMCKLTEKVSKK